MPLSQREFRARFTQDEKRRIYAAAAVSVDVRIYLDDLAAVDPAAGVDVTDPQTIAGVQALAAANLLDEPAADRVATILAEPDPVPAASEGGFTIGQTVRLVGDFAVSFPGNYTVAGLAPGCVVLDSGLSFAPNHVEAV